jgi:hypothetical protein
MNKLSFFFFLAETRAIQWSSTSPVNGLHIYACQHDTVTIHWQFVLGQGDVITDVQWIYDGHSQEAIATSTHGHFIAFPAFSHRMDPVGNAGISVRKVVVGDSGNYTVELDSFDGSGTHFNLRTYIVLRVSSKLFGFINTFRRVRIMDLQNRYP